MISITIAACVAVVILVMLLWQNRGDRARLARTTAALADSESRLRMLAETVPAGIFQVAADGTRLYANPRLTEITGDTTSVPGQAAWLIYDDDREHVSTVWRAATDARTEIHL